MAPSLPPSRVPLLLQEPVLRPLPHTLVIMDSILSENQHVFAHHKGCGQDRNLLVKVMCYNNASLFGIKYNCST